jgi:hypothetical protein
MLFDVVFTVFPCLVLLFFCISLILGPREKDIHNRKNGCGPQLLLI